MQFTRFTGVSRSLFHHGGRCLLLALFAGVGLGTALPPAYAAASNPAATADEKRPVKSIWLGGVHSEGDIYHFKGVPGTPGKVVRTDPQTSKDTVFTMMNLDFNQKTRVGVATGDPQLTDDTNLMTADEITFYDKGTRDQRKAVMEGHVKIVHHPDPEDLKNPKDEDEQFGDLLRHDVVLTCDHAEYFYRLKTGWCTGHIMIVGEDKEDQKPVKADLTADRLEFEQKNDLYRAIGSVLIHDGDRTAKGPKLTAVMVKKDGKRKVQSIDMDGPSEFTGFMDESEENGPENGSSTTTAATAAAGGTTQGTAAAGTSTGGPTTGGTAEQKTQGSQPGSPTPGTPTPDSPTPAAPAPATPATPTPAAPSPATPNPTTPGPATPNPAPPGPGTPANPAPATPASAPATPGNGATPTPPAPKG